MISKLALIPALLLSFSAFSDVASDVERAILDNLKNVQSENMEGTLATMHSQSPSYLPTQQMLQKIFPAYDLKYELVKYQFVGSDDEYAYAKVLQKTTKVNGAAFQDNEVEALQVFKKENNQWKLWAQANLSINFK